MTKNKKHFYISILPLLVIVVLIIGAGYLLFADDIKWPKSKGPTVRRLDGFPTIVYVDAGKSFEKQRKVFKSEEEVNQFLNSIDKTGMLAMRSKVDFSKEYVVAVATEVENPETHKVKIQKLYENKDDKTLLVSIKETYPGENCTVETAPHIGVDMVAINKTDWSIDFERVQEIANCKDNQDESKDSSSSTNAK